MKRVVSRVVSILLLSCIGAISLAGCIVVPEEEHHHHYYHHDRDHDRDWRWR